MTAECLGAAKTNSLKGNVHKQNEESYPRSASSSRFFDHANVIERIDSLTGVEELIKNVERRDFLYTLPPELCFYRGGEEKGKGQMLKLTLSIPETSKEGKGQVTESHILVFDTPENNAMTIGRFALFKGEGLRFQLARFHTSVPAQEDMKIAMYQAVQAEEIGKLIAGRSKKEMFLVYLTREGHMVEWHGAVYHQLGKVVPYTIAHVEHEEAERDNFGREAKVCEINLKEGLHPSEASLLMIGDNTASGMQQVAVAEKVLKDIEKQNGRYGSGHHISDLLVVSPLLTVYGAAVISRFAAEEGITTTFVTSGAALGCNLPERYYSPIKANPNLVANPGLIGVIKEALGVAAGKACVRCNWTASFVAPDYAMKKSDDELKPYGVTNEELIERCKSITPDSVKEYGVKPQSLMPYSTFREEAEAFGPKCFNHVYKQY